MSACGPSAPPQVFGTTTSAGAATAWEPGDADGESSGDGVDGDGGAPGACACTPGEPVQCASSTLVEICAADCHGSVKQACGPLQACIDDACRDHDAACDPGETICDEGGVRQCAADGTGYGDPVACEGGDDCAAGACMSPCDAAAAVPSSQGCSFFAMKMDTYYAGGSDGLVVANPSQEHAAHVQVWEADDEGVELAVGDPRELSPGESTTFLMNTTPLESTSAVRRGESFCVSSDRPVVAYQHAPASGIASNDGSALLPEHSLGTEYVVASYPGTTHWPGHLAYFDVIAANDGTTVSWTPPVPTEAADGVPAAAANATESVQLDRYGTLQVAAAFGDDLTGTIVEADGPVWVVGASACAAVPQDSGTCDHIQEQMIPLAQWGTTAVAAHAPARDGESYYWRVLAGADGVSVTTTPDQLGAATSLDRGEWVEIVATESFVVRGDGPILAVQYLESQDEGSGRGDPSMIQAAPVEQFLREYTYATPNGYDDHYTQVVRPLGGAEVTIDGDAINDFVPVGMFEVADLNVAEGPHRVRSSDAFGLTAFGYNTYASYGYSAGQGLEVLSP
ncbi:MAG: IgGFc-binding protein [Myxococcota bacterium]